MFSFVIRLQLGNTPVSYFSRAASREFQKNERKAIDVTLMLRKVEQSFQHGTENHDPLFPPHSPLKTGVSMSQYSNHTLSPLTQGEQASPSGCHETMGAPNDSLARQHGMDQLKELNETIGPSISLDHEVRKAAANYHIASGIGMFGMINECFLHITFY